MDYRSELERLLGRKLERTEVVHHKDGDHSNNKVNNLEVIDVADHNQQVHPTKQEYLERVIDLIHNNISFSGDILYNDMRLLFTDRQIEIILRRFFGMGITKLDREIFSRKLKKKLMAIRNPDLQKVADIVSKKGYKPV